MKKYFSRIGSQNYIINLISFCDFDDMVGDVLCKHVTFQRGILVLIILMLVFQLLLLNFDTKSFSVRKNIEGFRIQNVINFQIGYPQNVMSNVILMFKLLNDLKVLFILMNRFSMLTQH